MKSPNVDQEQYEPTLSMKEFAEKISSLGIKKANTESWQLCLLGALAGLYISLGGLGYLVALSSGCGKLPAAIVFCSGLIMVVIAGAELFTGNIIMIVGTMTGHYSPMKLLKNWTIVYVANLLASLMMVWMVVNGGMIETGGVINELGEYAAKIADIKMSRTFMNYLIRGFFCNMLVIIAYIMATLAKDIVSKVVCIIFPTALFVLCGFEHCVANMFLIPLGMWSQGATLMEMTAMTQNLIPVTIGNVFGGIFILIAHPNRIRQLAYLISRKRRRGDNAVDVESTEFINN